jgi:hypothetical protein
MRSVATTEGKELVGDLPSALPRRAVRSARWQ